MKGGEETASSCDREGLDWISGSISLGKELPSLSTGCWEVTESPCLEVFKQSVVVAPGDMVKVNMLVMLADSWT